MKTTQGHDELKALIEGLNEEEMQVIYGYGLALKEGDAATVEAMDAAKDAGDFELAREISRKYIEGRNN